jgi:hypothetical protein
VAERQWNVLETLDLGIDGLDHVELIGRGGSSRVYRARQTELDRLVALKVINVSDDSDVARRFDRERKAMGRLSLNDGIVPIYSSGLTDNGEPYLIMPYYPNGSLQDRLERGRVPWTEAVEYITAVGVTPAGPPPRWVFPRPSERGCAPRPEACQHLVGRQRNAPDSRLRHRQTDQRAGGGQDNGGRLHSVVQRPRGPAGRRHHRRVRCLWPGGNPVGPHRR